VDKVKWLCDIQYVFSHNRTRGIVTVKICRNVCQSFGLF